MTAEPIHRLVYFSEASDEFRIEELDELLARSRANNESLGISGILLCENGHFLQMLEGPMENVIRLYTRIRRDPRHQNIVTILEGDFEERQFAQWTMAYFKLDDGAPGMEDGYLRLMTSYRSVDQLKKEADFVDQYLQSLRALLSVPG